MLDVGCGSLTLMALPGMGCKIPPSLGVGRKGRLHNSMQRQLFRLSTVEKTYRQRRELAYDAGPW